MNPVVPAVIGLALQSIVLSWIFKLERQCNCSKDWRRDFIKYYSFTAVAVLLATLAKFRLPLVVSMTIGLAALVNLYSVLSYVPMLNRNACTCATEDDWRDNFIYWYMILSVVMLVLASGAAAFIVARR
jgi:hypothetical protein